jgi:RNA polymerase sigma factor (sigma-70 family)
MPKEHFTTLLRLLRRHTGEAVGGALSDGQLLERFVGGRDQAAFEALFWRHAPMVLAVCRRLLGSADAEDAFQATFLVLVRKAASIGRREAVGGWLYRVAYRVALRARASARPAVELPPEGPAAADDQEAAAWRDLRPLLDEAIAGLPEKYRAPVVLCYLEGRTNEEAARELGCPKGTVAVRLMRARERLRRRLERCRLLLPAALLAALLAGRARAEAVEAVLAAPALRGALGAAAQGTLNAASAHAAALAQGVMRAMYLRKMKLTVAFVIAVGVIVGGGVWWRQHAANAAPGGKEELAKPGPGPEAPAGPRDDPAGKPASDKGERRDVIDVASPRDGIVQFVGTEIILKPGEKPPDGAFQQETTYLVTEATPDDMRPLKARPDDWAKIDDKWYRPLGRREEIRPGKVRIHRAEKWFVPLKKGDAVKPGQLLAVTDPSLAVDELAIKLAKLDTAEAERAAEEKQRDEYRERWARADALYKKGASSFEDMTAAKLAYDYHVYETVHKQEDVKVAARELRKAQTELEMHEVRSKVRGVVAAVDRYAGEGVKALDPIVRVRLDDK